MSQITLDEAIVHLEESTNYPQHFSCQACYEEHLQLLVWLKELRERRNAPHI